MASHHHLHHHQVNPLPTSTTTCCCSCNITQCHHPPPPSSLDPLLQAIASHLLHQQQSRNQTHRHSPLANKQQTNESHQQKQHFHQQRQHFFPQQETHFVLSSLFRRIDALESSLHHFSTSMQHNQYPYSSLRDLAARVIQTHFRAFLVRRSRTLRQLKDLAVIKSSFNSLKSSISNQTRFDFNAISKKAMDLLLKLDSIQGGDLMIRDGKRSISRDLVRLLEFIDELNIKRHEISFKAAKNVRFVGESNKSRALGSNARDFGGDQREMIEKLRERIEQIRGFSRFSKNEEEDVELEGFHQVIDDDDEDEESPRIFINGKGGMSKIRNGVLVKGHGGQSRVKKSLSFSEDGNVYRVFGNTIEPTSIEESNSSDGSFSSNDYGEEIENHSSEVEEIKGLTKENGDDDEAHLENGGGSPQSSDEERSPRRNLTTPGRSGIHGEFTVQNGSLVFTAPLPVKMESRADLLKKIKAVKFVT